MSLRNALFAEFGSTTALLAIVVGSGTMGESLAQGNAAIALRIVPAVSDSASTSPRGTP